MQCCLSTACFICGVANDLPTVSQAGNFCASLADRIAHPASHDDRIEARMNALALIGGLVLCGIIAVGVAQIIKTTTKPTTRRR